jgi:hypothetical protein
MVCQRDRCEVVNASFARHDERHALRHQPGHECDVTGEAVELGYQDAAFG